MVTKQRTTTPSEFSLWEVNRTYNRDSGTLKNDATAAGTDPPIDVPDVIGQPVIKIADGQYQFATTAEVGTPGAIDGFVVDGEPIVDLAADEVTPLNSLYSILEQGPANLNQGGIPAADVYGDAIVEAEYILEAETLRFRVVDVPVTTEEQVT